MAIKQYESVVVINASLEDSQIEETFSRVSEFLKTNGGEFLDVERWGRKRLAYPIQKSKSGYYIVMRFKAQPEMITKLERIYKLDETIVRYLTVVLEKDDVAYYDEMRKNKTEDKVLVAAEKEEKAEETAESK